MPPGRRLLLTMIAILLIFIGLFFISAAMVNALWVLLPREPPASPIIPRALKNKSPAVAEPPASSAAEAPSCKAENESPALPVTPPTRVPPSSPRPREIYLVGTPPRFTCAVWLGRYDLNKEITVRGRPTYTQHNEPARALWHSAGGEWTVGWTKQLEQEPLGLGRGFLSARSEAQTPPEIPSGAWLVANDDGTWEQAPSVRVLVGNAGKAALRRADEDVQRALAGGAEAVVIASKGRRLPHLAQWLGRYARRMEADGKTAMMQDGRPVYASRGGDKALWFSSQMGNWVVSLMSEVGTQSAKLYANALSRGWFLPEHVPGRWHSFNEASNSWTEVPEIAVTVAPAQK